MKTLRSLSKLCLRITLIGINVVLIGFLARSLWLEPILKLVLEDITSSALQADVEIARVRTNLWNGISLSGIQITGDESSPIQHLEGGSVSVAISVPLLLDGDLRGLRYLSVQAKAARVQWPSPSKSPAPADSETSFDAWIRSLVDLHLTDIASGGIRVTIPDFSFTTQRRERRGDLNIRVSPGTRFRELTVRLGEDLSLDFQVKGGDAPHASGRVQVSELAGILQDSGIDTALEAGRATGTIHADLNRRELHGDLVVDAFKIKQTSGSARLSFLIKPNRIFVDTLYADLKGLDIRGSNIVLPGPSNWGPEWLANCRGGLDIEINDLSPYAGLLPRPVRELMPITGRFNAWVDREVLHLGRGSLHCQNIRLRTEKGKLPIRPANVQEAIGFLAFQLDVNQAHKFELPDGSTLTALGSIRGRVDGSLLEPSIKTEVQLAAGAWQNYSWERVSAKASFENYLVTLRAIDAEGLRHLADARPSSAGGSLGISFLPNEPVVVRGQLKGKVSADWLRLLDLPAKQLQRVGLTELDLSGTLQLPSGAYPELALTADFRNLRIDGRPPTDLHLKSTVTAAGKTGRRINVEFNGKHVDPGWLTFAGLSASDINRFTAGQLSINADVTFPAIGQPRGSVSVALTEATIDKTEPFAIRGSGGIDQDDLIAIKKLEITGLIPCAIQGTIPLRRGVPGNLHAEINSADLQVLTKILRLPILPGKASGTFHVHGLMEAPDAEAKLTLHLERPLQNIPEEFLPSPELRQIGDDLNLGFQARLTGGSLAVDKLEGTLGETIQISASGTLPIAITAEGLEHRTGSDLLSGNLAAHYSLGKHPLDLTTEFELTAEELSLNTLAIRSKKGVIRGQAHLQGLARAVAEGSDLLALPLQGTLAAESFDLRSIPISWIDIPILEGTIQANIQLAGTLGHPEPMATLTMEHGLLKAVGGVPALHDLTLDARVDSNTIELKSLAASVGAGKLECKGTFDTQDEDLIRGFDKGVIDFKLTGDDVLAYRKTGIRVRANANIRITGTPDKILVGGQVDIRNSKLVRRATLLPDLRKRGMGAPEFKISQLILPPEIGNRLHFDLHVQTSPNQPIAIRTHVLDADIQASLILRGTGTSPILNGAATTEKGTLRLPAVGFSVDSAIIRFTSLDIDRPDVVVRASGRRHGFDIQIYVTGKLDNLEVHLTSSPALPPNDLLVLVSTGALPSTLASQGVEGNATLVGGYLLQELADFYFGNDSTDREAGLTSRFHFESGREVSEDGVSSMIIEFDLIEERFKLQAERDKFEEYNMGILYRIRF